MIRLAIMLAIAVTLYGGSTADARSRTCSATEAQLIGAWQGMGSFEQMKLEKGADGNRFSSWLHNRPEHVGLQWTFVDCSLRIISPGETLLAYNFFVKTADQNRLYLINKDDGSLEMYKKMRR